MLVNTGFSICDREDTLLSHRLVVDSKGRLWLFFQNPYRSLSCGFSDDGGVSWSQAVDLLPDISGSFSVCAGGNKGLHLAARRLHPQDIHYLRYDGSDWWRRCVYPAREKGVTTFFPVVKTSGQTLFITFWARKYSAGECSVVQLKTGAEDLETFEFTLPVHPGGFSSWPKKMGFLNDVLFWSGDLAVDGGEGLHLAYRAFWRDGYNLFYTHQAPGTTGWAKPERVTDSDLCEGHPALWACDDDLYLLYHSRRQNARSLKVLARKDGRWIDNALIPLEPNTQLLSEGILPWAKEPAVFWAQPGGCTLLPPGWTDPKPLYRPEGKKLSTCSPALLGDHLGLAFTLAGDPLREIYFTSRPLGGGSQKSEARSQKSE